MDGKAQQQDYLTLEELVQRARISASTIHRLKRDGKIPFYQPAGKNGRLLFPANAIEQSSSPPAPPNKTPNPKKGLSGPKPKWLND